MRSKQCDMCTYILLSASVKYQMPCATFMSTYIPAVQAVAELRSGQAGACIPGLEARQVTQAERPSTAQVQAELDLA